MSTQSTDPAGYPFIAVYSFKATSPQQLELKAGMHGKVIRSSTNGWLYVGAITINGQMNGFVPASAVKVGSVKFGQITIESDIRADVKLEPVDQVSNHQLEHATNALLSGLKHSDNLSFLPSDFLTKAENIPRLTRAIMYGVQKAGLLTVFGKSDFTVDDIIKYGRHVTNKDALGAGVYIRIYRLDGRFHVYGGKTIFWGDRWAAHRSTTNSVTLHLYNVHYQIARKADKYWMIPVCALEDTDANVDEMMRTITEQMFILLLQTYSKYLFDGIRSDMELDLEDADVIRSAGSTYVHSQTARLLSQVAETVLPQTGWPGGVKRASFGAHAGLNYETPLATYGQTEKTAWVKTTISGFAENYRRPEIVVTLHHKSRVMFTKVSVHGSGDNFQLAIPPKGPGPVLGTKVYFVVEIALGSEPHPRSYARLPHVGRWSNWLKACQLAFRVEWQDGKSVWHSMYLQAGQHDLVDPNVPGSMRPYADALAFYHFLKQERLQSRPAWIRDFGLARVREARFDNLTQVIRVQELKPRTNNVIAPPRSRDLNGWIAELNRAGAVKIGTTFGKIDKIPGEPSIGQPRKYCDYCYILRTVYDMRIGVCRQIPGTDQCEWCAKWGHPCSWTSSKLLTDNPARLDSLAKALVQQPRDKTAIEVIDDPELQIFVGAAS